MKGQIISVDDQDVQVFEYRSIRAAELDAKKITDTRSTSLAMWIAPPHFFTSGRLIVLYVGEVPSMLETLTELLGPQFAGFFIMFGEGRKRHVTRLQNLGAAYHMLIYQVL